MKYNQTDEQFNEEDFMEDESERTERIRKDSKNIIRRIDTGRGKDWWTTPVDRNNKSIVPYEVIEDDLYHYYFSSSSWENNKFETGIARIAIGELEFDLSMEYAAEYTELKKILEIIMTTSEKDKFDENLNGLKFPDLYKKYENSLMMEKDRMKKNVDSRKYKKNQDYIVVRIKSFEDSKKFKKYTNPSSPWFTTYNETLYNEYTNYGKNSLFYIVYRNFRDIKKPEPQYDNNSMPARWINYTNINSNGKIYLPYDEYGLSMIMMTVNKDNEIINCSGRWNNEILDFSKDFMNEEQISLITGRNFYDYFCKQIKAKD